MREAYLDAKKREAQAKTTLAAERVPADELAAKLSSQLGGNAAAFEAWMRDFAALRSDVDKKFEERIEAAALPAELTDKYTEYKRQFNIFSNYSEYLDDDFFRNLTNRIQSLQRQIEQARQDSDKKIAVINEQIAKLQERKKELDKRLGEVVLLPVDKALFAEWVAALAEVGHAEQATLDAEVATVQAFDKFVCWFNQARCWDIELSLRQIECRLWCGHNERRFRRDPTSTTDAGGSPDS